jgi:hypothetical protein
MLFNFFARTSAWVCQAFGNELIEYLLVDVVATVIGKSLRHLNATYTMTIVEGFWQQHRQYNEDRQRLPCAPTTRLAMTSSI